MKPLTKWIVIITCMLFYAYLLKKHVDINREIKYINKIISEVNRGNYNIRFRILSSDQEINRLCIGLNNHLDSIQKTFERKRFLEEERKKLISNISHDLRTPLTSLLGYLEAVLTDNHLPADSKVQYIEVAYKKATHLYQLIQDFFCLSKIESHDYKIHLGKVNLVPVVENVITTFYNDLIKHNLSLTLSLPQEPIFGYCDDKSMERILHNLVSNAIKYGSDGKIIGIALENGDSYHQLKVWDHGKGISSDDLPHIFKRLYTTAQSRNNHLKGNGLGLTIVKKLVEMQGGNIEVTSKRDEKTEFIVHIPRFND